MSTQKEDWAIDRQKIIALRDYLYFCCEADEIPKEMVILLITSCNDVGALKLTIDLINNGRDKLRKG